MRKFLASLALVGALALTVAIGAALAAPGYTLFGEASVVPGGNPGNAVKMVSDSAPGYGGVDYAVPAGTTFADLQTLSTDYKFEADDSCGGGSPRFQVDVTNGTDSGTIFVYIGPPPAYTLCPPNVWTNTGDLLEGVNPIDTSQLDLGTFYDPYAAALLKYGSYSRHRRPGGHRRRLGLHGRRADGVRRQHEHRRRALHVRKEPAGQRRRLQGRRLDGPRERRRRRPSRTRATASATRTTASSRRARLA